MDITVNGKTVDVLNIVFLLGCIFLTLSLLVEWQFGSSLFASKSSAYSYDVRSVFAKFFGDMIPDIMDYGLSGWLKSSLYDVHKYACFIPGITGIICLIVIFVRLLRKQSIMLAPLSRLMLGVVALTGIFMTFTGWAYACIGLNGGTLALLGALALLVPSLEELRINLG